MPVCPMPVPLPAGRKEGPASTKGRHRAIGIPCRARIGNSHEECVLLSGPMVESTTPLGSTIGGVIVCVVVERSGRCNASTSSEKPSGSCNSSLGPRIRLRETGPIVKVEVWSAAPGNVKDAYRKSSVRPVPATAPRVSLCDGKGRAAAIRRSGRTRNARMSAALIARRGPLQSPALIHSSFMRTCLIDLPSGTK
jgi:hypothetical protein